MDVIKISYKKAKSTCSTFLVKYWICSFVISYTYEVHTDYHNTLPTFISLPPLLPTLTLGPTQDFTSLTFVTLLFFLRPIEFDQEHLHNLEFGTNQ